MGGKTAKIEVLPGFCEMEHGGGSSGGPMMWPPLHCGGLAYQKSDMAALYVVYNSNLYYLVYDQAQLSVAYSYAYQATKEEKFSAIVEDILTYVKRDLGHPLGAFYSAEDADSKVK